jgi:hypothetical protein
MTLRVRLAGWFGIITVLALTMLVGSSVMQWLPVAQAVDSPSHTYVSGNGVNNTACYRSAPCRTFDAAQNTTTAGGTITCLDAADYGSVVLTRSMTINCGNGLGGISSTLGVAINDGSGTAKVILRGLDITYDPTIPGGTSFDNAINFLNGASLVLENVTISRFPNRAVFVPGRGGGTFVHISVSNSTITDNGIGQSGGRGIVLGQVPPAGTNGGVIRAVLNNVQLIRNNIGLRVSPNTEVTLKSSTMEANISYNLVAYSGGGASYVNAEDCIFAESVGGTGIHSEGFGAQIRVSRSTITGNNLGLFSANFGQILSAGNNILQQNFGGNGAFTGSIPQQ